MPARQTQVDAAEAQILEQSKRIEFYLTEYSVELLALKMERQEFEIPAYQREDTWEPARKDRFIESLLMGLPIPFLFFWEIPASGKLEVVDGSQRLRTIHQFLYGNLTLGKLVELTQLQGMKFRDLPESRQRKIRNRSIRGIVLNEHADERARFDLFERINTGSKIANPAEVRRGALGGPFIELVTELSTNPTFESLAPMSDKQVRLREREELVTRFFAYGDGLDDYRDRVSPFLFDYAKRMTSHLAAHPDAVKEYRRRFLDTMAFVERVFPIGFRRTPHGTATPRTRFEAIAVGSYLALKKCPALATANISVQEWLTSKEFESIIGSDGANVISRLQTRLHFVRDHLIGASVQ
ncbi:MAG: DUF262 domain-containing protein [Chloroflexota bacterium]|nr:DUF262 domain-containing protein [Chloroflexota bacterium]